LADNVDVTQPVHSVIDYNVSMRFATAMALQYTRLTTFPPGEESREGPRASADDLVC